MNMNKFIILNLKMKWTLFCKNITHQKVNEEE